MSWRIVDTDNLGGDYPDEKFLLWPMPEEDAKDIARILNHRAGPDARRCYKAEEDGYVLAPGFEP